jgi:hypothetical protein
MLGEIKAKGRLHRKESEIGLMGHPPKYSFHKPQRRLKKVSENSGALPPLEQKVGIRTFVSLARLHLTLLHHFAIQ